MTSNQRNTSRRNRFRARAAATNAACHICGQPIDYTLKWPDPKSFVMDHKVPLARGGTDTYENAAASHADCNSTKRARVYAPIIRRSSTLD